LKIKYQIILLIFFFVNFAFAEVQSDSLANSKKNEIDSTFVMTKSPWGAVGRSAIIPGWGQYYNEAYWKIPVVWGVLGWFTYLYVENNKLYKEYGDLYSKSLEYGLGNEQYRSARNTYRNERDKYALVLGLSYLLNLVDAYVDAHMFDFDVSENPITKDPQLNMHFKF